MTNKPRVELDEAGKLDFSENVALVREEAQAISGNKEPITTPLLGLISFLIVLLAKACEKQAKVRAALRPAGRRAAARAETFSPCIRFGGMRSLACFARAHCPKLEPLADDGDAPITGARIRLQSMSQNNHSILHVGLDVAKLSLQLHLAGRFHSLVNDPKGHAQLLKLLQSHPAAHVICEATGGSRTSSVVRALQAADIPVTIVEAGHIRYFARAQGQRAKTDPIDSGRADRKAYRPHLQTRAHARRFKPGNSAWPM